MSDPHSPMPSPLRVLFIGNSQMSCFDLPGMVAGLAQLAPPCAPRIHSGKALVMGKGLNGYWDAGDQPGSPRAAIADGPWDYVVIQEIFCAKQEVFLDYAQRFDQLIRDHGARTILFATANVTDFYLPGYRYPDSFRSLNEMQLAFGRSRGIPVAAAGLAWLKYLGPHASVEQLLDLYAPDKGHPGFKGTAIYACLLYAVITGCDPRQLPLPASASDGGDAGVITPDQWTRMCNAAWQQYQEMFVMNQAESAMQNEPKGN